MLRILRKFAASILLLAIPLQGAAAAASTLKCLPIEASAAYSHDSGTGEQERGGAIEEYSGHSNCHQLFPGIPVFPGETAAVDASGIEPSTPLPPGLIFPEPPQRPPLGARV